MPHGISQTKPNLLRFGRMANPQTIITGLTRELNLNPQVLALVLVGSQAREDVYTADEYSDLEAYLVVSDDQVARVEQELPTLVAKFGPVLFSFKHAVGFVAVYDDLFRIELPVVKESQLAAVFSRPQAQITKVLFDKTKGALEKVLAERPETLDFAALFADKVTNFWYWQILGVGYFKKGELYNARAILNIHTSALIKLLELLNDPQILLLETNKRIEKFLSASQQMTLKQIAVAYDREAIKQSLKQAMAIFPTVFGQIKNKYGYDYDESLEEKVTPKLKQLLDQG